MKLDIGDGLTSHLIKVWSNDCLKLFYNGSSEASSSILRTISSGVAITEKKNNQSKVQNVLLKRYYLLLSLVSFVNIMSGLKL